MNESSILFVGLDVRRDGIDLATADAPRDGEMRQVGTTAGDLASLDKVVRCRVHGRPCCDHAPPHGVDGHRHRIGGGGPVAERGPISAGLRLE